MRVKPVFICRLVCLVLGMAFVCLFSTAQGQSSSSPLPVGVTAATTVDNSDIFDPSPPSDVEVTILKIIRAGEAWKMLKEANASNKPPKAGFEYVLARLKLEYHAREGTPQDKSYDLREDEFIAVSADGKWYEVAAVVTPEPRFNTKLYSGKTSEGWVSFLVPIEDKKPQLFFQRGGIWFQLFQ